MVSAQAAAVHGAWQEEPMASRTKALKEKRKRKAAPNRINERGWTKRIESNVALLQQAAREEG